MENKPTISAIIIAKNEEGMIANCIETLDWCDEVLVVDNDSSDATAGLAEQLKARVIKFSTDDFSKLRSEGLRRAKTNWIFYIDADERVTPALAKEIMVQVETTSAVALRMKRSNIIYGKEFSHGGWQHDRVTRVFKRTALNGWKGKVHESPLFTGRVVDLHSPLLHLTHRNTSDGLIKTATWTAIEAELLYKAGVGKVGLVTIMRKAVAEFLRRAIFWQGRQDGVEGWIEALIQAMNKMLIYIQVWEHQQKPSLPDRYKQHEFKIAQLWKKES